jgi:two-component system CheB/CheR fusion protein
MPTSRTKAGRTQKAKAPQNKVAEIRSPQKATSGGPETRVSFPIVAIGASAGGLEAFSNLLRALPSDPGVALVFIPHLDPTH